MAQVRTPLLKSREDGSVPLALLAAIVVAGLVTVLFASTVSGQRSARFDRDFTEVLHHSDAGVQEALFRFNAGQISDTTPVGGTYDPYTTGPLPTIDGNEYDWTVKRLSRLRWEATSVSDVGGVDRTIVAVLEERPRYFPGGFADNFAGLNGTSTKIDSYDSRPCSVGVSPSCHWAPGGAYGTGNAALGSNNTFDFSGNTALKRVLLYNWAANPGTGVTATDPGGSRCNNESAGSPCIQPDTVVPIDFRLDYDPDASAQGFIKSKLDQCAAEGRMNVYNPAPGLVVGGSFKVPDDHELRPRVDPSSTGNDPTQAGFKNFYCFDSIEFLGDATVDGVASDPNKPVVIFVKDFVKVSQAGAKINCNSPELTPAASVPCDQNNPRLSYPRSSALQIFSRSSTSPGGDVSLKSQAMFAGVLHAPAARCFSSGGGVHIFGSIVCKTIDNVGNWEFHFDDALGTLGQGLFDVVSWHEQ